MHRHTSQKGGTHVPHTKLQRGQIESDAIFRKIFFLFAKCPNNINENITTDIYTYIHVCIANK